MGFLGDFGPDPKCDYSSSRPPKGTSLRKSASFKLICKNPLRGLTCRRVDRKCDGHTHIHTHTQVNLYSVHALHWTNNDLVHLQSAYARHSAAGISQFQSVVIVSIR